MGPECSLQCSKELAESQGLSNRLKDHPLSPILNSLFSILAGNCFLLPHLEDGPLCGDKVTCSHSQYNKQNSVKYDDMKTVGEVKCSFSYS
jgi:hypothetical protein